MACPIQRKEARQEERQEGRQEGRMEASQEGRKEGRQCPEWPAGRKEGVYPTKQRIAHPVTKKDASSVALPFPLASASALSSQRSAISGQRPAPLPAACSISVSVS
jgi:hypothetical protein